MAHLDQTSQAVPPEKTLGGGLEPRNVRIAGRRTSVRLEPQMWSALEEVAKANRCTIHDLCTAVQEERHPQASFTAALRVFLVEYYRAAAVANPAITQIRQRVAEVKSR
ncbi:MAG TPA: ribbon-helix-helix domain-containing protein [Patescibacteria group bacterium]|nr:ribbon-helix-helix domain-containing protein [Patescibacteria group bacterium]